MIFLHLPFIFTYFTLIMCTQQKKEILFIINPKAGVKKTNTTETSIIKHLDHNQFNYKIAYTKAPRHATTISRNAIQDKVHFVIAVGGDGTVNEVAKGLISSNTTLAIIPKGSGNGLARHLKIPMQEKKAIRVINEMNSTRIDTVRINNDSYIGIAGVGFDAQVSLAFSKFGKRGLSSYLMVIINELHRYQPKKYELIIDGEPVTEQAFLITFANSAQYGNNIVIAPQAKINDGLLDVIIVKDFPKRATPRLIHALFNKQLNSSKYTQTYKCKKVLIKKPFSQIHIDGEPVTYIGPIFICIIPSSLKILIPGIKG